MQQIRTSARSTRLSKERDLCGRARFSISPSYYKTCNASSFVLELHSEYAYTIQPEKSSYRHEWVI